MADHVLNANGLVTDNRWVYCKRYSTDRLLVHLTETWIQAIDTGYVVGVAFIQENLRLCQSWHPPEQTSLLIWLMRPPIKLANELPYIQAAVHGFKWSKILSLLSVF